jgi:hypothetical protein
MTSQDAIALLVPIVTAAIGSLGILLQDRRLRRSATEQHRVAFEDAIRRVTFAAQWVQAKQTLGGGSAGLQPDDEQLAQAWVNQAAAIAQSTGPTIVAHDPRSMTRRLFLLYELKGWAANAVRVAFYLPVAYLGWIALIALGEVLSKTTYPDQLSWEVTGSVLGGVAALVLRGWAVALDARKRAHLAAAP